ncbi:MAG: SDR family NAD(P)-dependent oxidoreductase, partial [Acidimicrobiales bacterium]
HRVAALPADVTDEASVAAMTEGAVAFAGGLDALVTCAGVISRGESATHDWALWARDLEVNVGGTYRCARAAFPALRRSGAGAVVTVGSLGSFLGMPQRPSYDTAKAGVLGLTRTLAVEWGPVGVRANAVAPGFVDTEMMRSGMAAGLLDERRIMDRLPLRRLGRPGEIAEVAVFLASPRAAYVTGAVVPVDGGLLVDGTFF